MSFSTPFGRWILAWGCLLSESAVAQVSYLGGEFRVPETTQGSQISPRLARHPETGRVLAVWQSFDQDGSGSGIYGRLIGSDGTLLSSEQLLAVTTAGQQISPVAVGVPTGFLVAWASEGADGNGYGIVLRRFGTNFQPLGGEVTINETISGNQIQPTLAVGGAQAVLAWTGPNSANPNETDVFARRIALDGTPLGQEFRAPQLLLGNQSQPAVAVADDSSFLVAWTGSDDSGYGVFARKFDAAGNATTGDLLVPSVTLFDQVTPAATALAGGGFLVAWSSALQPNSSGIGPQPVILAQRFSLAGTKVGSPIQVTAQTLDRQELPAVALQSGGEFLVGWEATILATGDRQTRGRRYAADGALLSAELPLNTTAAGEQAAPSLTDLGGGRFLAAWQSLGQDGSSWGIYAQRFGTPLAPCEPSSTTLCLAGRRFRVRAQWTTPQGQSGTGQAVTLTSETGYFWFFDSANVEIVIKVLDACGLTNNFWVFAAGLTDVFASIEVLDTRTGESRTYSNPLGTPFRPIQDTGNFFVCSALQDPDLSSTELSAPSSTALTAPLRIPSGSMDSFTPDASQQLSTACVADATTLCLRGGRFAVRAEWATSAGTQGLGRAVPLTSDTGYFWFFDPANVEVVLKVLDGCSLNQRYWVFAGGLTDVYVRLTVRDTLTGAQWVRENPQRTPFQPIQDVWALAVCP